MHCVAEEEGTLICVAVKEGKLPVLGKTHRIVKSFRSIPTIHSNEVRRRELMVWNVHNSFGLLLVILNPSVH